MLNNLCEYKPVVSSFRDVCPHSVSYDSKPTPKETTCLDKEKNVIMAFSECCTENEWGTYIDVKIEELYN